MSRAQDSYKCAASPHGKVIALENPDAQSGILLPQAHRSTSPIDTSVAFKAQTCIFSTDLFQTPATAAMISHSTTPRSKYRPPLSFYSPPHSVSSTPPWPSTDPSKMPNYQKRPVKQLVRNLSGPRQLCRRLNVHHLNPSTVLLILFLSHPVAPCACAAPQSKLSLSLSTVKIYTFFDTHIVVF